MNFITIKLPAESRVLLLEDSPMRIAWFKKRVPNLTVVSTVDAFKAYLAGHPICDFIFFDHDLGEGAGTGLEAAQYLKDAFGGNTDAGLIHTWNSAGAKAMQAVLQRVPYVPFGQFEVEVEQ